MEGSTEEWGEPKQVPVSPGEMGRDKGMMGLQTSVAEMSRLRLPRPHREHRIGNSRLLTLAEVRRQASQEMQVQVQMQLSAIKRAKQPLPFVLPQDTADTVRLPSEMAAKSSPQCTQNAENAHHEAVRANDEPQVEEPEKSPCSTGAPIMFVRHASFDEHEEETYFVTPPIPSIPTLTS
ncbi:hypothetical protein ACHHYP_07995 [Achlya hypogyna]|uniref:Uncharacterized protein n=1 Tax=Achlya hypogyna TaxID=1202772 RepID=A0A1V9YQ30_ACHHY|nr:hypothetical protein ACHHYP_07995 [Achlya hypogyna]